jgi:acyl-CoA synthetase (AMP-forming)/AMP-acid ligase II
MELPALRAELKNEMAPYKIPTVLKVVDGTHVYVQSTVECMLANWLEYLPFTSSYLIRPVLLYNDLLIHLAHSIALDPIHNYKIPTVLKVVDGIERNAMGKVNKKVIVQKYWPEYC